jgi:hypothetical protein
LKRRFWKWATLFIGTPSGNLVRVLLPGLFEKQMEGYGNGKSLIKLIWAPILYPDYVRSRVWVQSGIFVKDQGFHDLASEYGVQRACFKV